MVEFLHDLIQFIGLVPLWIGVAFCVLAVLGLYRFPDVYSRLHASGKVSTMGLAGLLLGTALIMPSTTLKGVALALFIVITSPVSTHAIALAAYRSGVPMVTRKTEPIRDDLQAEREP